MKARAKRLLIYLVPIVIALMIIPILTVSRRHPGGHVPLPRLKDTLRCVIAMEDGASGHGAGTGFNYVLLRRFAEDTGRAVHIRSGGRDEGWTDSLRADRVDLVVLQERNSPDEEGLMRSCSYDSTLWLMRAGDRQEIKVANSWITDMVTTDYYARTRKMFLRNRKKLHPSISPYDDIIKKYADRIGWDWRLVAALIYHESRFSIEAESTKGAVGLMQVMPIVYSAEMLLDPETNIAAGTRHLKNSEKIFRSFSADSTECVKFTIAAYNGGEGRIQKYVRYAAAQHVDSTRWDSVIRAARSMESFSGGSIEAYVNAILNTYYDYTRLYRR